MLRTKMPGYRQDSTIGFGPEGRASKLPAPILGPQDQCGRVQKERPGGGIGRQVPEKGPGLPNLTFSTIFELGRAVSPPWRDYLLRPATPPRTFIFFMFFITSASEPSNSIEISLFCCFQGHRLPGYPHQTLENLQVHPYCIRNPRLEPFYVKMTNFTFLFGPLSSQTGPSRCHH